MKSTCLEYKGYTGSIEPDIENNRLFGKLEYMKDVVTYDGKTIMELEQQFRLAVDQYLEECAQANKQVDKPFKGSFNVRTGPELHREAVMAAGHKSLNSFICDAITEKLHRENLKLKSMRNSFTSSYKKQLT